MHKAALRNMKMPNIASRLKYLRIILGFTQDDMASLCNVGKRTYVYWESGDREFPFAKLFPLVKEFNLNLNWLMTGEGEMLISEELHQDEARERELEELRSELKKIATRLEELDARRRGRIGPDVSPG